MAGKTREELDKEATELGLEPSNYATKAELEEAILESQEELEEDSEGDEVLPEDSKEEEEEFVVETTKKVEFNINGKKFEGDKFVFDNAEVAEARKEMLVERFGKGIIKE